jgi:hypothetical protein
MHTLPNWDVAWLDQPSSFRLQQRHRDQRSERNRLELKVVCAINPSQILNAQQHQILEDVKLDGHWLFSAMVNYLPHLQLDLLVPRGKFQFQILQASDEIRDLLYNDIVSSCDSDVMSDDDLIRLERYLEEYLPDLANPIEEFLSQVLILLSHFDPPAFCQKKDLLKYLSGYSLQGNHAALLHFDFRE